MKTFVPRIVKQRKAHLGSLREQIREAAAQLEETKAEVHRLKADVHGEQKKHRDVLDELAKRSVALERIRDFVDGRITHYVMSDGYGSVSIVAGPTLPYIEDRRAHGTRLLSLFGNSGGNWSWMINRYSDGSGSWFEARPCTSAQEAQLEANKMLRSVKNLTTDKLRRAVDGGVVLDDENQATFLKLNAESMQAALANASDTLARADVAYQEAKEKADAADAALRKAQTETT